MEAKFRSDLVFVSTSEVGVNTRNRLEAVHASVVDCFLSVGCSTWGNYRAPPTTTCLAENHEKPGKVQ